MLAAIAFVLSFISSTFAITITSPNNFTGWTTSGGQQFTWTAVDSDPANFSVSLTNQHGLSNFAEVQLLALVNTSALSGVANPPAGGFIAASGYSLYFRAIPNSQSSNNGILANTDASLFTISAGSSSISGSGSSGSSTPSTQTSSTAGSSAGTTDTSGNSDSSATGSIIPTSTPTSGATSSYLVQSGLLVLVSLLGFALA